MNKEKSDGNRQLSNTLISLVSSLLTVSLLVLLAIAVLAAFSPEDREEGTLTYKGLEEFKPSYSWGDVRSEDVTYIYDFRDIWFEYQEALNILPPERGLNQDYLSNYYQPFNYVCTMVFYDEQTDKEQVDAYHLKMESGEVSFEELFPPGKDNYHVIHAHLPNVRLVITSGPEIARVVKIPNTGQTDEEWYIELNVGSDQFSLLLGKDFYPNMDEYQRIYIQQVLTETELDTRSEEEKENDLKAYTQEDLERIAEIAQEQNPDLEIGLQEQEESGSSLE